MQDQKTETKDPIYALVSGLLKGVKMSKRVLIVVARTILVWQYWL